MLRKMDFESSPSSNFQANLAEFEVSILDTSGSSAFAAPSGVAGIMNFPEGPGKKLKSKAHFFNYEPEEKKELTTQASSGGETKIEHVLTLADMPDDALRHITSFYTYPEILGLMCACKRFYTMPFMGYVDDKQKYIQVVIALDTTGSMQNVMQKLKSSVLMTLVRAKKEYPDYTVLFSIVEFGDIDNCFFADTEHMPDGSNKVAELIYTPHNHFISIQCPLRTYDKIYKMVTELELRGGGGPEAFGQAIIHVAKEFGTSWVGCLQPFSPSVAFFIMIADIYGHNMGGDKATLFHKIFEQHGMSSDWFKAMKQMARKNVMMILMGLTTSGQASPEIFQYIGRIFEALGGIALNINENMIFDLPRLIVDCMKPELYIRSIMSDEYNKKIKDGKQSTNAEVKCAIKKRMHEGKDEIPEIGLDPLLRNTGTHEYNEHVRACDNIYDMRRRGFIPTVAVDIYLARLEHGYFRIVGEIDPEASRIRKCRRSSNGNSSLSASSSAGGDGMPMGMPTLIRQLTCSGPPTPPSAMLPTTSAPLARTATEGVAKRVTKKTVTFAPQLSLVEEDDISDSDLMPPPMLPMGGGGPPGFTSGSSQLAMPCGLTRQHTSAPSPMGVFMATMPTVGGGFGGFGGWGAPAPPTNVFSGSRWDESEFKTLLSENPVIVPSRMKIGINKPLSNIAPLISPLELFARNAPLDQVKKRLLQEQPYQKDIIEQGFKAVAQNLGRKPIPQHDINMLHAIQAPMSLTLAASVPMSFGGDGLMPPMPTLERTSSVFVDEDLGDLPILARSRSVAMSNTNSQALRNLSQLEEDDDL
jgi:hypothetical protein